MDIGDLRREYMSRGLDREDLNDDPILQFESWFREAMDSGMDDPNAMSLATCGADGQPSVRTVLLKFFDARGFVFYTNYESRKARQLDENPRAALLFPWLPLNRQVKIEGEVEKVSSSESLRYFSSRPRGSQLGAWVSQQSHVISSRQFLEMKLDEMRRKFGEGKIPLPSFWGGYRVKPTLIEFWQGRESRLHDRFQYRLEGGQWVIERLAP
ncbi:pyridoxamine 5'-phosphate oxidase [Hahella sp. SMD15-11]|uniref:Pyridoxine/pyridoxamine 5'-phosphate oxidase n=1 Tax=Thermohahella caldifontis TaxID=3142973 RepID=A0AB39UZ94_9GAMM